MKKPVAVLIAIVTILICAFSLSACGGKRLTKEEVIPAALGAQEGLWLYRGNTRSRTDGTESQTLMTSVTIDGADYATEDFVIRNYCYITPANRIFFVISQKSDENADATFLYIFDYKEKTGRNICELSAPGTQFNVDEENKIVYIMNGVEKFLYDFDGNKLYATHESIPYETVYDYYLSGYSNGVFYCSYRLVQWFNGEPAYSFFVEWWKNGETHIIETDDNIQSNAEVTVKSTHLYFLESEKLTSINLNTETLVQKDFTADDYSDATYISSSRQIQNIYYDDDAVYVLSLVYLNRNDKEYDNKYYFHKISDSGCEQIGEFDVPGNYGCNMSEYKGSLYISLCVGGRGSRSNYKYYSYDLQSGELKRIKKNEYHGGTSGNDVVSASPVKQVGEYKFYVSSTGYGYSGFLWGYEGYCHYLNREYNGKKEIMQYSFSDSYFFDDICAF